MLNKNPNRPKGRGIFSVVNTLNVASHNNNPVTASGGVFTTNKKPKFRLIAAGVIVIFMAIQTFSLFVDHDIWWDSSVYIGMGKYIFSLGESGLWEPSRPLLWPLALGFFWKIGISPIFAGKILLILISGACLSVVYLMAARIYNDKTALISALILAFSSTFFLYNSVLQTEIPSLLFVLLGVFFFIDKKYGLSGLMIGIAFMTRFFTLLAFFGLAASILVKVFVKKVSIKQAVLFFVLFLVPLLPYLMLSLFLYGDFIYPFTLQANMTQTTGWVFNQPFWFYWVNLLKENILLPLALVTLISAVKKRKDGFIPSMLLFTFVPFNLMDHKEMRLILIALPFLAILAAEGLVIISAFFRKYSNKMITLVVLFSIGLALPSLSFNSYDGPFGLYHRYLDNNNISGVLWISNPAYIVNTDYRAELLYYPTFDNSKMESLDSRIWNSTIMINTCDTPCPPWESECEDNKKEFIGRLKEKYGLLAYDRVWDCDMYIFG